MNMTAARSTCKSERLTRMGLLAEPAGYVDGQNLYEYVTSNPATGTDPTGLQTVYQQRRSATPGTGTACPTCDQRYRDRVKPHIDAVGIAA